MDIGAELSKVGEAVKSAVGLGGAAVAADAQAVAASAVNGAETAVASAAPAAATLVTSTVSKTETAVVSAAESAGATVMSAVAGAGPMIEKALPLVEDVVGAATCLATGNVACAITNGMKAVGDAGDLIGGAGATVAAAVQKTVTTVAAAVEPVANPVVQQVGQATNSVIQAVEAAGVDVAGLLSQLFAGGVVSLIEKEAGTVLSADAKARVLAVVQGLMAVVGSLKF